MKKKKISNSFLFFFDFTTFPSSGSNRKIAQWSAPSPTPSPLHCIPYQATPPLPIEFRYFTTSCVLRKRSTAKVKFQNYDFKKDNPKLYAAPSEKWAKWAQRELRSFPTGFSSIFLSLSMFQPLAWQRSGRSFRTVGTIVTKQEKKACPMRRCHSANSSIDTYIYLFARYGSGFERIFLGKFAKLRCAGQVQPELTMGKPTEHVLTIKGATMSRAMTKWSDWSVVDQSDDKCHGA